MYLAILETALLIIGFLVFMFAIGCYVKRTGDVKSVLMFWQADMKMNPQEFIIRRSGILIMILGIALRFFNHW